MKSDSIWTAGGSNVINGTEFYQIGKSVPGRTVAMKELGYKTSSDDYIVGGMVLMFFVLAWVMFRSRSGLLFRLKAFFTNKRLYVKGDEAEDNTMEAIHVFLLMTVSALSLSIIFFDDMLEQSRVGVALGVPYWLFGAGFVLCFCFIYAKAWTYVLVNWVFSDRESSRSWMSGYFLMTSLTAFFFYPIALMDVFFNLDEEIVIWSTILVAFLYEILLFYKLCINFRGVKGAYLLNFLYFCSVELLPIFVVGHLVMWFSESFIVKNILY